MTEETQTTPPVFAEGETVTYYKPKTPAMDINGKPFREGGRVITNVPGKEFQVVYATRHENEDLQSIYEEFKLVDNKVFWLQQNASKLKKFDVDVNNLIEMHQNAGKKE